MEDRSSLSSFFKSSLRAPFPGSGRRRASEVSEGQSNADTTKTPYERRRQQVRRAQRKHRQKRENYVIALEEEIRHLRRELHTSQLHNRVLSDALSSHGVSIQGSSAPLQSNSNMARVALVGPPGPNSFLQLQKTDSTAFSSPGSGAIGGLNSNVTMQSPDRTMITDVDTSPQYARGDYTSPKAAVSSAEDKTAGDSAVDDSGLEFVLTLERPCLLHTGHPSISDGMQGHALTLNAVALACAPAIIEPNEAWSMPTASLERLLELSSTLGLKPGTQTPVQAWQRVRSHPRFPQLTSEKLRQLVELLSKEVKCHGFGAVLNEKTFDAILRQVFR